MFEIHAFGRWGFGRVNAKGRLIGKLSVSLGSVNPRLVNEEGGAIPDVSRPNGKGKGPSIKGNQQGERGVWRGKDLP